MRIRPEEVAHLGGNLPRSGGTAINQAKAMSEKLLYRPQNRDAVKYSDAYHYLELVLYGFTNPKSVEKADGFRLRRHGADYEIFKTSPKVKKEAVKIVQTALVKLGFLKPSQVDGDYGPKTAAAISKFQKMIGEKNGDQGNEVTSRTLYYIAKALAIVGEAEEKGIQDVKGYWQSRIFDVLTGENIGPVQLFYDKDGVPIVEESAIQLIRSELFDQTNFMYTFDKGPSKYITAALIILGKIGPHANDGEKVAALELIQTAGGMKETGPEVGEKTLNALFKALEAQIRQRSKQ